MKRTDLADSTRGKYEGLLRSHILPTFGKVELRRLAGAASTVRAWYYELDQRYPDGSTANDAYRCLRSSTRPWRPLQHGTRLVTPLLRGASSDGARILGLRRMDIDVKREQLQVRLNWVMPPGATRPVLKEPKSEAGKSPFFSMPAPPGEPAGARDAPPAAEVLGDSVLVVFVIGVVIPSLSERGAVVTFAGGWQLGGDPGAVNSRKGPGGRQPVTGGAGGAARPGRARRRPVLGKQNPCS